MTGAAARRVRQPGIGKNRRARYICGSAVCSGAKKHAACVQWTTSNKGGQIPKYY